MPDRGRPLGFSPPARYLLESAEACISGAPEATGSFKEAQEREGSSDDWWRPYQPHPDHRSSNCLAPEFRALSCTDLTLNGSFYLASFFCGDLLCLVWEMAPDPVEFSGLPDHRGVGKG